MTPTGSVATLLGPVVCVACGREVPRKRRKHRFCSPRCRAADWDRRHPRLPFDQPEAAKRRDEALARVEEKGGDWMELAGGALEGLVAETSGWEAPWERFKTILLQSGLPKPHHPNAWGALVRRAVKAGWLERVGYCTASSPESHGTEMRVYRVRP